MFLTYWTQTTFESDKHYRIHHIWFIFSIKMLIYLEGKQYCKCMQIYHNVETTQLVALLWSPFKVHYLKLDFGLNLATIICCTEKADLLPEAVFAVFSECSGWVSADPAAAEGSWDWGSDRLWCVAHPGHASSHPEPHLCETGWVFRSRWRK